MSKYRGKYTNARNCRHAKSTEGLMSAVQVRKSCPFYGRYPHNLVLVGYCQYVCDKYEKERENDD